MTHATHAFRGWALTVHLLQSFAPKLSISSPMQWRRAWYRTCTSHNFTHQHLRLLSFLFGNGPVVGDGWCGSAGEVPWNDHHLCALVPNPATQIGTWGHLGCQSRGFFRASTSTEGTHGGYGHGGDSMTKGAFWPVIAA